MQVFFVMLYERQFIYKVCKKNLKTYLIDKFFPYVIINTKFHISSHLI